MASLSRRGMSLSPLVRPSARHVSLVSATGSVTKLSQQSSLGQQTGNMSS